MHNTSLFDFPRRYLQHLLKSDPDYKQPLYISSDLSLEYIYQTSSGGVNTFRLPDLVLQALNIQITEGLFEVIRLVDKLALVSTNLSEFSEMKNWGKNQLTYLILQNISVSIWIAQYYTVDMLPIKYRFV